jgi:hypothetical protein
MSLFLWTLDPQGETLKATLSSPKLKKWIRDDDLHKRASTPHRTATSNLYWCTDGKFSPTHGSFNRDGVLDILGLPHDTPAATPAEAWIPFKEKVSQINSAGLQDAFNVARQAGSICHSVREYLATEHGKSNTDIGVT